jgi:hypothetical protein
MPLGKNKEKIKLEELHQWKRRSTSCVYCPNRKTEDNTDGSLLHWNDKKYVASATKAHPNDPEAFVANQKRALEKQTIRLSKRYNWEDEARPETGRLVACLFFSCWRLC